MNHESNSNLSSQQVFIDDLIASSQTNKTFKKFIDDNLNPKIFTNSKSNITQKINYLSTMSSNEQAILKARAKDFEEDTDVSKYLPALLSIILLIISSYKLLSEITNNNLIIQFITFAVTIVFAIYAIRLYFTLVKQRSTAVYFNSLINNIKYNTN